MTATHDPFVPGRGVYGWNYADDAVAHVEEHNCAKGCNVPNQEDIAEFGPGGACVLLAALYAGEPIPEFEGTHTHVICHARNTEVDGQNELFREPS
jgi:hypothetical protein